MSTIKKIWWISNIPRNPFWVDVKSVEEAALILNTLAYYDLYLGDLIATNASGAVDEEGDEWSNEEGQEIWDIINEMKDDKP